MCARNKVSIFASSMLHFRNAGKSMQYDLNFFYVPVLRTSDSPSELYIIFVFVDNLKISLVFVRNILLNFQQNNLYSG